MKKISVTSACSAFQWPIAAEFVSKKITFRRRSEKMPRLLPRHKTSRFLLSTDKTGVWSHTASLHAIFSALPLQCSVFSMCCLFPSISVNSSSPFHVHRSTLRT